MRYFGSVGKIVLYLGIGCAIQAAFYADLPVRSLFIGDQALSAYAHILAWPLFVALYMLSWMGWFLLAVFCIALLVIAAIWCVEQHEHRQKNKANQKKSVDRT